MSVVDVNKFQNEYVNLSYEDGRLGINLFGAIGWDVSGEYILNLLTEFKNETIDLNIMSPGGSVLPAIGIYEYCSINDLDIHANIYGFCGSAATVISCGCKTATMAEDGYFMIHNVSTGGDEDDPVARQLSETLINIYKRKTGKPKAELRSMMADETWFTAKQALEMGFINKVVKRQLQVAMIPVNKIQSKMSDNKKGGFLNSLREMLGLQGKTEEEILEAVESKLSANDGVSKDDLAALTAKVEALENNVNLDEKMTEVETAVEAIADKVAELVEDINAFKSDFQAKTEEEKKEVKSKFKAIAERMAEAKVNPFKGEVNEADGEAHAEAGKEEEETEDQKRERENGRGQMYGDINAVLNGIK